jgi:signal transduction histidine kinase/ActR/RegA family two-component response regulator
MMNNINRDRWWSNRWRLGIWALMLAFASWMLSAMHQPTDSHPAVRFVDMQFQPLDAHLQPVHGLSSLTAVTLPDNWRARGLPSPGAGRYLIRFNMGATASLRDSIPWAVRIDHLCGEHRIKLNGRLLTTTLPEQHRAGRMTPEMIDMPPDLLRDIDNELQVDVSCLQQGGLSPLVIAPKPSLRSDYLRARFFLISLPLAMNIAGLAFSFFLLMLWWLRGEEASIGLLGLMTLIVSMSNAAYYVGQHMPVSPQALQWMHYMAYTTTNTLSGLFVLAFTRKRMPIFKRVLWTALAAFTLLGLAAIHMGWPVENVRARTDLVMLMLGLPSTCLLLQAMRKEGWRTIFTFASICLPLSVTGFHDYIYVRLLGDPMAPFWAPMGLPFAIPGIYLIIAERAAHVIRQLESSNQTLEARVAERTSALVAANSAKGDFLAAASHDLRQPMVAIGLIVGMLKDRIQGDELRAMTGRLSEAVESMDNLLNRLLDLSRLEAGAFEVSPQRVALQPLFDAIVAHESVAARAKGLRIQMRPTHACVWSDPVLLEQVLRNLISNALRYTDTGGVLVAARRRGSQWLIQVWDTGIGIAPEHQSRIFDDFVQLSNPGRNAQAGLGLGLALVKRAAGLLGADVSVRSQLGRGSCFELLLPMAASTTMRAPAEEAPPAKAPSERTRPTPTGRTLALAPDAPLPLQDACILVLEDDPTVRMALDKRLCAWGASVVAVGSLHELRAWLPGTSRPHVLLTDQRLGDGTGLQAMALVRERWPGLAAVVVTGDTAPAQLQCLYGCGAPVLHKPFRVAELLQTLQQAVAGADTQGAPPLQSNG